MTTILAIQQLGPELDDFEAVRTALKKIPEIQEGLVKVDFSGCIIDYEPTSVLIDHLLQKLSLAPPPRELTLIYNVPFLERVFLKWFFLGSEILQLNEGTAPDDEIKKRVVTGFQKLGISLRIICAQPGLVESVI